MSRNRGNGFEEWGGYMDAKITKLNEQYSVASYPYRQFILFDGISIFVNGLTDPSADELKRIMMIYGGTYHHYERPHTTYIIASHLPDVKVRNMDTSKIISPQWVVDCLAAKRVLNYRKYLLYTNENDTQPVLNFKKVEKRKSLTKIVKDDRALKVAEIYKDLEKLKEQMLQETPSEQSEHKEQLEKELKYEGPTNNTTTTTVKDKDAPTHDILSTSSTTTSSSATNTTSGGGTARTAVDPKFLSEFYNNSRLHHIATLGAGFKQYVNELREKHGAAGFPARQQLKAQLNAANTATAYKFDSTTDICVMHIDMDCFFVSVGLRKHPHLRGQAVAVTHSKGGAAATEVPVHPSADRELEGELFAQRFEKHLHNNVLADKARHGFDAKMSLSEIASCSYEARATGIHNGMFVGQAIKLCPNLKTIPYDFDGYKEVAYTLYDTIAQYTLSIEAVSCDEMFVELTEVLNELQVSPMVFVSAIREEVRQKTGCPCSAGVGANKLQARMATKRAKPDGQYHLLTDDVSSYMADVPIKELPGVGSCTAYTLEKENFFRCGDLQKVSLGRIQMLVGKKLGETLHQFCHGIDKRALNYEKIRRSVSAEVNYGIRFQEAAELENFLRQLCTEVHTRLSDIKRKTKCVTLKLMVRAKEAPVETSKFMGHGVCDNVTKSVSLSDFTNDLDAITRTVLTTMKALALPPNELRGIGIQLSKLDEPNEHKEKKKENIIMNLFNKVLEKQKDNPVQKIEVATTTNNNNEENKMKNERSKLTSASAVSKTSPSNKDLKRAHQTNTSTNNNEAKKRTNNIREMWQNAANKKVATIAHNNTNEALPADIDPEVFKALPADIRAEILAEYRQQKTPALAAAASAPVLVASAPAAAQPHEFEHQSELDESDLLPSTSKAAAERRMRKMQTTATTAATTTLQQNPPMPQVDADFLAALPDGLRRDLEMHLREQQQKQLGREQCPITEPPPLIKLEVMQYNPYKIAPEDAKISDDNIFAETNTFDVLSAWVDICKDPEGIDIAMISKHACEFVRARKIEELYAPMLMLCKLINSTKNQKVEDCAWHFAYKVIVNAIQNEMMNSYDGCKLFIGDKIKCDKCTMIEVSNYLDIYKIS